MEENKKTAVAILPQNGAELITLIAAFLTVVLVAVAVGKIMDVIGPADSEIRKSVLGLLFGALGPLTQLFRSIRWKKVFGQQRGRIRSPWYSQGVGAAAILITWTQFITLLGVISIGGALRQAASPAEVAGFLVSPAFAHFILILTAPLTALATVVVGFFLQRSCQKRWIAAALVIATMYPVFNVALNSVFNRVSPGQSIPSTGLDAVGFTLGAAIPAALIVVLTAAGALISLFTKRIKPT